MPLLPQRFRVLVALIATIQPFCPALFVLLHCVLSKGHNMQCGNIALRTNRCKDGVKVLWCHSHLVWLVCEGSIPTFACLHLETFATLCIYIYTRFASRVWG